MKRHWKKIVIALAVLVVVIVAGSWLYAKVINKAPAKLSNADLEAALDAPITEGTPAPSGAAGRSPTDVTGIWRAASTSVVRYRVDETVNGFSTTAVGTTNQITGTLTIDGDRLRAAGFTVDMGSFASDESRRDSQFRGRIMDVERFPTATFNITQPIRIGSTPADGDVITATATGQLTLHGATNTVTFDVQAMRKAGRIGIIGTIPIVFADYGIPNPSIGFVSTKDHGELEFVLVLTR